jgi:universal stress protein A
MILESVKVKSTNRKHMKTRMQTKRAGSTRMMKPTAKRSRRETQVATAAGVGPLTGLKRILVPIDFSKPSLKALRYAVPVAEQFGGQIFLICVLERASYVAGMENMALVVPEKALAEEARVKLLALAREEIEEVVPVDAEVRIGKPFVEIVELAKEKSIDLIILATHGYTGLKHVLMGSTAEQVVRHAPCPVLVVREREKEFVRT